MQFVTWLFNAVSLAVGAGGVRFSGEEHRWIFELILWLSLAGAALLTVHYVWGKLGPRMFWPTALIVVSVVGLIGGVVWTVEIWPYGAKATPQPPAISSQERERMARSWIKLSDEILAELPTWERIEWRDVRGLAKEEAERVWRETTDLGIKVSARERSRFNRMFGARIETAFSEMEKLGSDFRAAIGRSSDVVNQVHLNQMARRIGADGHRVLGELGKDR